MAKASCPICGRFQFDTEKTECIVIKCRKCGRTLQISNDGTELKVNYGTETKVNKNDMELKKK